MMTNEERKQRAREAGERRVGIGKAIVSAHGEKNAAKLGEHFADDAESTWIGHRPPRVAKGRQQIIGAWEPLWRAVPNLATRLDLVLVNENQAVAFVSFANTAGGGAAAAGTQADAHVAAAVSWYFADWEKGDDRVRCEEIFGDRARLEAGLAPAVTAVPGVAGAASADYVATDADAERINLAVVNAMNTGLKIGELDGPMDHYAADATLRLISDGRQSCGKAEIRKALQDRWSTNAKLQRLYAWCADAWVVAEYGFVSSQDAGAGEPPLRELHLFEVRADQIKAHWIFGQPRTAPGS